MNANELAEAMEIRASIRRKATSRKSVQEGANDRLADQLEEAATMLRQLQTKVDGLQYNADLHTKKIHWLAINYPEVNNHLLETIKTGEMYNVGDK